MIRPKLFGTAAILTGMVACSNGPRPVILQDKGSDTIVNLMARMSEAYLKVDPAIVVAVNGGGSGTGIKSLIDGTTDIANSSREIKDKEIALAKEHGINPVPLVIAMDGLAIYVNDKNPIDRITFEQLKCIYSAEGTCTHWSDVGVKVDCGGDDKIIKVNRQNNSGTYEYFKEVVLGKHGKFTNTMDQSGTQQVADVVGTSACAIGYGGMGYGGKNSVRYVCLAKEADGDCHMPTTEEVRAGGYPFSRPLYVYTNGAPTGAVKDFLGFVMSEQGQEIVIRAGFVPAPKPGL